MMLFTFVTEFPRKLQLKYMKSLIKHFRINMIRLCFISFK